MCHRRDLAEYADGRLRKAVGGRTNVTFVGVHVRRTDYARHLQVSWLLVADFRVFVSVRFRVNGFREIGVFLDLQAYIYKNHHPPRREASASVFPV